MYNRTKKLLSIGMMLCLTMTLVLSGCGSNESKSNNSEPQVSTNEGNKTNEESKQVVPDANKKYTISVAIPSTQPRDPNGEILKYYEEKFNADYDVWDIEAGKYEELLNLKFASGEIPDRFRVTNGFVNLAKYVDQDLLAEIPIEMLKEHAPYLYNDFIEKQAPGALEYGKIDGKLYGIPHPAGINYRKPIIWRGDWLEKVGITKTPESLEEFEEAFYKFVNEDPDNNGKKDTYGLSQSGLEAIYGAFGYIPSIWQKRDGQLVYASVQPEVKQALAYLSKWYKDGVIDPEFITGENQGGYSSFSQPFFNSRIGFTSVGGYYHWKPLLYPGDSKSENFLEMKKINPTAVEKLQYGLPPKGPEGKMGSLWSSVVNGNFEVFGKDMEKDPEKMAKMLQDMNDFNVTYEDYLTSIFGFKGQHWDNDKETGLPALKEGVDANSLSKQGVGLNPFAIAEYDVMRAKPRFDWADEHFFAIGGIANELLAPLPSDSKYKAELKKMEDEMFISIITGDKPLDYFDEFVSKWEKSGGAQLTKEANEWFSTIGK
ncbi:extracellular solute-binding protein [Paenibacillus marinisediminis]